MRLRWFWFSFRNGLPVTFHPLRDYSVQWVGIHGVQVGNTFIGAVRSRDRAVPPRQQFPATYEPVDAQQLYGQCEVCGSVTASPRMVRCAHHLQSTGNWTK